VRITHITDCFDPRTGGIETQVRGLAERQSLAGHTVRVITATPGPTHTDAQVPVVRISAHLPFDLPVHPTTRRRVERELTDHPCDVVHVHAGAASPFAWGGMRAARSRGIPIVVTIHSMWDTATRWGNRILDATPWGIGHGAVVTAVGSRAAERVEAALGLASVGILPNAIDVDAWRVHHMKRRPGSLRVVSVLRMAPRKRAVPLVAVLGEAIKQSNDAIEATVIGDGPDRWRVERYLAHHDLQDRITLTGLLPRSEIRQHFAESEVFCQVSVHESFGIAALEARAAGLVVVARTQSGTADFIADGVEGFLVHDDAGAVAALTRLRSDPEWVNTIMDHNARIPPVQAWPEVLRRADDFYAQAQLG
jgi:phosphatidylinositol alpha 1,6-mannosyltransferase